jgi:hypothetical protein
MKVICGGSLENPMILKLSNSSVQYYNFRLQVYFVTTHIMTGLSLILS